MGHDGDDDLRINTLHRFAKHSPRLILHEYSHCEVPAGCGGVVLRWIDPAMGVPGAVSLFVQPGGGTVWLDGVELAANLALFAPGRRVVAVHAKRSEARAWAVTVGAMRDDADAEDLISRGSPSWRSTFVRPPDNWFMPELDDSAWDEPVASPSSAWPSGADWMRRQFDRSAARGQPVFAYAAEDTDEVWLRVRFEIAAVSR